MKWILCVGAIAAASWAAAETPAAPAAATSEQEEAASLMAILNEETAVATRTKTNADFVPGIVTVLSGDEYAQLEADVAGAFYFAGLMGVMHEISGCSFVKSYLPSIVTVTVSYAGLLWASLARSWRHCPTRPATAPD